MTNAGTSTWVTADLAVEPRFNQDPTRIAKRVMANVASDRSQRHLDAVRHPLLRADTQVLLNLLVVDNARREGSMELRKEDRFFLHSQEKTTGLEFVVLDWQPSTFASRL